MLQKLWIFGGWIHGHCKTWLEICPPSHEVLSLRQGGKTQMEPDRWWSDRGIWNEGTRVLRDMVSEFVSWVKEWYWILYKFDKIRKEIVRNVIFLHGLSFSWNEVGFYFKYLLLLDSNGRPVSVWFAVISYLTDSQEVLTVVKNMDTKAVERCRQLHDLSMTSKNPVITVVVATQTLGWFFTPTVPEEMVQFGLIFL